MDAEVVIVGAGVAGCATALHLAARGREVVLLDRSGFPRDKVCGEGLMPHGVAELSQLGLLAAVEEAGVLPFFGIRYNVGDASAVGEFPGLDKGAPSGLGVRRWRLDAVMLEAAKAHPKIDVRLGSKVRALGISGSQVIAETNDGDVWGKIVVGADGLHSTVRKELGLTKALKGRKRYGVRAHFRFPTRREDRQYVDVHIAPEAEFYVTPTAPGEVNIALLLEEEAARRFNGNLDGAFYDIISNYTPVREYLYGGQPLTKPKMVGPLRQGAKRLVSRRALLVGDAGGFIDGITGEGMSIALVSARMAAISVDEALSAGRFEARDLAIYEKRQRQMSRDMVRFTETILWGIRYPRLAKRVVRTLGRHPDTFSRLLGVNTGAGLLGSLHWKDIWRLIVGS